MRIKIWSNCRRVWKPNHINQKSSLKVTEIQSRNLLDPPIDKSDTAGSKYSNYIMGSLSLLSSHFYSPFWFLLWIAVLFSVLLQMGYHHQAEILACIRLNFSNFTTQQKEKLSLLIFIYGFKGRLWIQRNGVLDHMLTQGKACLLTIMMYAHCATIINEVLRWLTGCLQTIEIHWRL